MEAQQKLLKLEEILKDKIKNIRPKFVNTRSIARAYKIVIIIIGVSVTVILGLEDLKLGKEIALILSGLLTAVTSLDALYNYNSKSIQEHEYYLKLSNLKSDIEYYKTGRTEYEVSDVTAFYELYKRIRTEFHSQRVESVKNSFENKSNK